MADQQMLSFGALCSFLEVKTILKLCWFWFLVKDSGPAALTDIFMNHESEKPICQLFLLKISEKNNNLQLLSNIFFYHIPPGVSYQMTSGQFSVLLRAA